MNLFPTLKEVRTTLANPDQWLIDWFGGGITKAGTDVNETSALNYIAVAACVRLIADNIGALPIQLYRRTGERKKEKAVTHYIYPLIHRNPNTEMSAFRWKNTCQGHLCTWGNSYSYIDRDLGNRVKRLIPLQPDRMVQIERKNNELIYRYKLSNGEERKISPNEMLHVPGWGYDGIIGYSPITLAREAIGLGLATEEFGSRFFGNGAHTSGVIKHPGRFKDQAAIDRFKKNWNEAYSGLSESHKTAILEEGMEYQAMSVPPEDAQFLETRKFQKSEIATFYRVPPHMIGDTEKSTSWGTGIEQQTIGFIQYTLMPWFILWEQELARQLLTSAEQEEYYFKFNVDALLRGDAKVRAEAFAIGKLNGWYSTNDIREMLDMNEIGPAGDVYREPLNTAPATAE